MAFKQPRVPPLRRDAPPYLRELILFLKDFCLETWMQCRRQEEEIQALRKELDALSAQRTTQ